MSFLGSEKKDLKEILRRLQRRDFSGNTGQAVKNSSYQLATNIIIKIGSLLFTIVLAGQLITVNLLGFKQPILSPDLFGLYSLALSTILLFSSFSDFGITSALITFIPKELKKGKNSKAKAYARELLKIKLFLLTIVSFILLISAFFISNYFYRKPIFLALLVGIFYIFFSGILTFVEILFRADNNFKVPMYKEIIFQLSRFILLPLVLVCFVENYSSAVVIAMAILLLGICYFITILYLIPSFKRVHYLNIKTKKLSVQEKSGLRKFLLPLSATIFSGVFFGYIDTIMLGHYVASAYISFYGIAMALMGSLVPIISFSSTSLFPLFSKLEGEHLERLFRKALSITLIFSLFGGILMYFLSFIAINIIYGSAYLPAVPVLKVFSLLVILLPILSVYDTYYISQKKTNIIAILLILSTILNIIFNFFGITYGLVHYGQLGAIIGASLATIASRFFYLVGSITFRRK